MTNNCPTCDAATTRYAKRYTTAWNERAHAMDAANAARLRACNAANAELDRVLVAHPHHAKEE